MGRVEGEGQGWKGGGERNRKNGKWEEVGKRGGMIEKKWGMKLFECVQVV